MSTKELIYEMLTENTGSHMLDSGGGSNRHWQKNQGKTIEDFENEDEETITFDPRFKELYRRVSVYHYLSELTQDEVCIEFNAMNNDIEWDGNYYGTSKKASDFIDDQGLKSISEWNTYNGESDLSQVLQGVTFKNDDDEYYFLIQIHGGADVRGGYTDAKLFKSSDFNDGLIHGHLWEYKSSCELEEELRDGYHDTIADENDNTITYTSEEVLNSL